MYVLSINAKRRREREVQRVLTDIEMEKRLRMLGESKLSLFVALRTLLRTP